MMHHDENNLCRSTSKVKKCIPNTDDIVQLDHIYDEDAKSLVYEIQSFDDCATVPLSEHLINKNNTELEINGLLEEENGQEEDQFPQGLLSTCATITLKSPNSSTSSLSTEGDTFSSASPRSIFPDYWNKCKPGKCALPVSRDPFPLRSYLVRPSIDDEKSINNKKADTKDVDMRRECQRNIGAVTPLKSVSTQRNKEPRNSTRRSIFGHMRSPYANACLNRTMHGMRSDPIITSQLLKSQPIHKAASTSCLLRKKTSRCSSLPPLNVSFNPDISVFEFELKQEFYAEEGWSNYFS